MPPARRTASLLALTAAAVASVVGVHACGGESTAQPGAAAAGGAPAVESAPMTRRVAAPIRRACRDAAARTALRVVCPSLVPRMRVNTDPRVTGAFVIRHGGGALYEITVNSGLRMHWLAGAGDDAAVRAVVVDGAENEVRGAARKVRTVAVGGRRFEIVRFGERAGGPHAGHVIALWEDGGTTAFVSVHGREHEDVAVAMLDDLARRSDSGAG